MDGNSTTSECRLIGEFSSIEQFTKAGLSDIIEATRAVNFFPQGSSRDLYCAYPSFGRIVDQQSNRILHIISNVLQWQNVRGNIQLRQEDEQFEMLLECNDGILERLNSNLDELAGIKKNHQTVVVETRLSTSGSVSGSGAGSWNLKKTDNSPLAARLITAKNIARPQMKFQIPVDNSSHPFVPKITEKPNSLKPLSILPEYDDSGNIVSYLHPYEFELAKFEPLTSNLKPTKPVIPSSVHETELVYVDSASKLNAALEELLQYSVIAIDLEHHSYRTFLGFTCLVQMSTRDKDYIFDAMLLREDMHILNAVLTDPKKVKIFHGADLDIEWLQRDLSLYVVNMFDTHQAAKALNFARLSLSYLLKHYCNIEADKTFQLSDWRIRPLPSELVAYARQDTHFLIYIFERLTNDLLDAANQQSNLLRTIYQRSTEICKKRYIKPPPPGSESHLELFRKSKRIFDNRQLCALQEIYQWRDSVAREEDESFGFVLPNHMMLQIAESLPREMQGILACCNPIPPLVRQHLHKLHQIVLRAREQPLVKPILQTDEIHNSVVTDYNSKLYCPHDLSHVDEISENLPTLINDQNPDESTNNNGRHPLKNIKPVLSIFEHIEQSQSNEFTFRKHDILTNMHLISVYKRYLAVLPLAEKEKLEEAQRINEENKKRKLCPQAPIKQEPMVEDTNCKNDDNLYSLPIKQFLKRKYEESVAKTIDTVASDSKRTKPEAEAVPSEYNYENRSNFEKNVEDDDSNGTPEEIPSSSTSQPFHRSTQKNKRNKFKNKPKSNQSSNKPVNSDFDYQKVDFKKFQGGAQHAKGMEIKAQFHGKNNNSKANNKKFNKLFTFSNVKSKK